MTIDTKLIDQLLTNYKKPEDIIGENGLLKELTKAILERALQAEMTDHVGYEKHDPAGHHRGNTRNGKSQKTLRGDFGELQLETPRDRQARFEPKIVGRARVMIGSIAPVGEAEAVEAKIFHIVSPPVIQATSASLSVIGLKARLIQSAGVLASPIT